MRIDRQRQLLIAFLLTAMWVVATGGRGYAQSDVSSTVVSVDVSGYPQVAITLDAPAGVDPGATATVEENGVVLPAAVQASGQGPIEVVLAVDTSGSMAGAPLDAAKAAATTFVQQLPPGARASVVGFGNVPYVVSPMTADRASLVAAIEGVEASGETALYDAIGLATTQFSLSEYPRSVVLVSDGGDTTSSASLDDATARLVGANARLFAVRMATNETNDGALEALATASHGRAIDGVDAAGLVSAYQQVANSALHQARLTYRSSAHGATTVRVELVSGAAHSTATASVPLPLVAGPSAPQPDARAATQPFPATATSADGDHLVVGALAFFVGLVVVCYLTFTRPPKSLLAANRRSKRTTGLKDLKGRFSAAMEQSLERRGQRDVLRRRLENAGIALRPGEYVVLTAGAALGAFFVGLVVGGGAIAIGLAALVGGISWLRLKSKTTKRRAAFERQLPELLQQLTSTLRAGYGVMQALDSVGRETEAPMCDEICRVVREVQLGRPLSESLESMSERAGCEDFTWVVQAIEINAEVGGDLVEVLDAVASTIRARAQLRRQIKTLSAQGRLTARILIAMPFVMAVLLSLIHPGYLSPFVDTTAGPYLIAIGAVLMTVGKLWLRRIVRLQF